MVKKLLKWVVNFISAHKLYNPKFKIGDWVIYNWMAKIVIDSQIKYHPHARRITYINHYKEGAEGLNFGKRTHSEDYEWKGEIKTIHYYESSCSAFWVRKASKKEIKIADAQLNSCK